MSWQMLPDQWPYHGRGSSDSPLGAVSHTVILGKCQQKEQEERGGREAPACWREAPACWATFNYFRSHQTENCPPWQISPAQRACMQPGVAIRTCVHAAPFIQKKKSCNSKHHHSQATGRSILCTSTRPRAVRAPLGWSGEGHLSDSAHHGTTQLSGQEGGLGRLGGAMASLDGSQNISTSEVGLMHLHVARAVCHSLRKGSSP